MFQNLDHFHQKKQSSPSVGVVGYYTGINQTRPEFPVVENWFFGCVKESRFLGYWKSEFMRINDFSSSFTYVDNMNFNGIDLQRFGLMRYYLTMHVATQPILQRKKIGHMICLDRSEDGPFKYLFDHNWQIYQATENLCDRPFRLQSPAAGTRGKKIYAPTSTRVGSRVYQVLPTAITVVDTGSG
jgi:hypothetical protein